MQDVSAKNVPQLWGLAVAGGLALAAFGAAWVAVGLSSAGAVFVAVVVFLAAAVILALPWPSEPPAGAGACRAERGAAIPAVPGAAAPAAAVPPAAGLPTAAAAEPVPEAPAADPAAPAAPVVPTRPQGLAAPRGGVPDDLKQIKGIGPRLEQLCHSLGYYHFDQIAAWGPAEVAWVDENLEGFKGRVTRDRWVEQARLLAGGGSTEVSRRVSQGDVD